MTATSDRLRQLYGEIDRQAGEFLARHPAATCEGGCSDCCRREPPLVSREEAALVQQALAALPEQIRDLVRERARAAVREVLQRGGETFTCPLLLEQPGGARCAVYAARPYACRTFGQTARRDGGGDKPFTCPKLRPRLEGSAPPVVAFRSAALRERVGVGVLVDSYLPVWVGLGADEQVERPSGPGRAVVVGS